MELRELRSFCTAARLRSISKAAEHLGIGQPTVTTHIKGLEEELGKVLFDRVKRPIQLTLAGAKLSELATPLVDGIDSLAARTAKEESEGPVSLASTHEVIPHTLLRVVKAFRSAYPHVRLRIRSGNRREVLQMVENLEVEIGIVPGPERGTAFEFEGLFRYERVLITPLGHPLLKTPLSSLEQIAQWPLILMGPRTTTRAMLEAGFRRQGLSYDIVVELDSMDMIKRYVSLGMGISVGPHLAIEPDDLKELGTISLATLLPVEQAGVVTLRGKTLSAPARNFIATMERTLA
ncbi:MAG: LysR family transcriptional regulator [Dehalococcoidia bacterium]